MNELLRRTVHLAQQDPRLKKLLGPVLRRAGAKLSSRVPLVATGGGSVAYSEVRVSYSWEAVDGGQIEVKAIVGEGPHGVEVKCMAVVEKDLSDSRRWFPRNQGLACQIAAAMFNRYLDRGEEIFGKGLRTR